MAEGTKHHISINVNTTYLAEQSDPVADRYVFSYTINIANTGTVAANGVYQQAAREIMIY